MPNNDFFKISKGYESDFFFTSVALNSTLPEYKVCLALNSAFGIQLKKTIPDLQLLHPNTEALVDFSFYLYEDSISKLSIYLIVNSGIEDNSKPNSDSFSLFNENTPRIINLFGDKNNSIFPTKDIRTNYYFIIRHPHQVLEPEKWTKNLKSIPYIQPISTQSNEYLKHHDTLMHDIELHICKVESASKFDIKRKKELLKKKISELKTTFGKISYDHL